MSWAYVIAGDATGKWIVMDMRKGGYENRIMCETDTKGKAKLLATVLNRYANSGEASDDPEIPFETAGKTGAAVAVSPDGPA